MSGNKWTFELADNKMGVGKLSLKIHIKKKALSDWWHQRVKHNLREKLDRHQLK